MKIKLMAILILLGSGGIIFSQNFPLGDVNHSGNTDITDALLIAQFYVQVNLNSFDQLLADVNASKSVDIVDALLIAQLYVGLIDKLPGEVTSPCAGKGRVTYKLVRASNPSQDQLAAYNLITEAMDTAVEYYSCYTSRDMNITVYYDPGVPTAQANLNGPISFGNRQYMQHITAMHEMGHCFGVGTHWNWKNQLSNGVYQGAKATAKIRELTGDPKAEIHGDTQHFWPYGLNYTSEVKSEEDLIFHCKIVDAIADDIGL
ncbi:MAG: hypothetical protein JXR70_09915 [Spirochaetales bacterium]|nr:hypothetical protein [Spirochaetales bacterium]